MPNWCQNTLIINGNRYQINKFFEENKDEENDLTFNKSVPIPENLDEMTDEEFKKICGKQFLEYYDIISRTNLYKENKWGTKWDACDVVLKKKETKLEYKFQTAWSPPNNWLIEISEKYNKLDFELISEESENDAWYSIKISEGEVIEERYDELSRIRNINFRKNFPIREITLKFVEILIELMEEGEEIDDIQECYEVNRMLKKYKIAERDINWYPATSFLEEKKNIAEKLIQKNKKRLFKLFCQIKQ